jgi:hypothetical protein
MLEISDILSNVCFIGTIEDFTQHEFIAAIFVIVQSWLAVSSLVIMVFTECI